MEQVNNDALMTKESEDGKDWSDWIMETDDQKPAYTLNDLMTRESDTCFDDLPIPLYNEIFKFLSLTDRNRIRGVSASWDKAIKFGFGVRVIIDNNNFRDVTSVEDVLEAQVRNLTVHLPKRTTFRLASGIRSLDICGMIYSKNLISLLTSFPNLNDLKFSRVYLETDLRLSLSHDERSRLPRQIESLSMRFLKTVYKSPGSVELGRNTEEIFSLTTSDTSILVLLDEFHFGNLKTVELYHDISDDIRSLRNSDMIERVRGGNLELLNPGTEAITRILSNILDYKKLKKLWVDNLPTFIPRPNPFSPNPALRDKIEVPMIPQLTSLQLDGITMTGDWAPLIRYQNHLKILDLVILNPTLIESVKLAVTNSSASLLSFSLIVSTPNDESERPVIVQVDPPIGPQQGQVRAVQPVVPPVVPDDDSFDLMFLFQCVQLRRLTIKYCLKTLDMSFLPTSLRQIELCGNILVGGLIQFLGLATKLTRLVLTLSDGPINRDLPPEHAISFNAGVIKKIVQESQIEELRLTEAGAGGEFEYFMEMCKGQNDICVRIDFVNVKVRITEGGIVRRSSVSVPRLHVNILAGFNRNSI